MTLLALWVSRYWSFGLMGRESNLPSVHAGSLLIWFTDDPAAFDGFGWHAVPMARVDGSKNWQVFSAWPTYLDHVASNNGKRYRQLSVPLWMPAALLAAAGVLLVRRDLKPFPPGRCAACGYNLRGSPSIQCPECGTVRRHPPTEPV